jgi:hypothetical protein
MLLQCVTNTYLPQGIGIISIIRAISPHRAEAEHIVFMTIRSTCAECACQCGPFLHHWCVSYWALIGLIILSASGYSDPLSANGSRDALNASGPSDPLSASGPSDLY